MASSFHNLTIVEAVETLSNLADLEYDREVGLIINQAPESPPQNNHLKAVKLLYEENVPEVIDLIKEIFHVILTYLKGFYREEEGEVSDQKRVEGIKTIMVLVGEAAKKLDTYANIFKEAQSNVTEFKEYKQLQDFYLTKIGQKMDEGVRGKWIVGLQATEKSVEEPLQEAKHVFVDLETVKKDTDYELFFIKKDDGTRFFSPRLLRNIKLVCDFGLNIGNKVTSDPLEAIDHWNDRILHNCARSIIKALGARLQQYYQEVRQYKSHDLIITVNKALMALLLSSHSQNLLKNNPRKSCGEYFLDFQNFMREALHSREYQKWLVYPPKRENKLAADLLDMIHTLCRHFYASMQGLNEMEIIIHKLLEKASQSLSKDKEPSPTNGGDVPLSKQLLLDYSAMGKLFKLHPRGPLHKVLDLLQEDAHHFFDPLIQHNLPNQLYDLFLEGHRVHIFRMAVPVVQETIGKADIDEEFKGFLRSYDIAQAQKLHLLINLEDRTSWKEHARCSAIEELQHQSEFKKVLCVVTLAIDTDFYHQIAHYHQTNHAQSFMEQFREHLLSPNSGFYFPASINRVKLAEFIDRTFESIHKMFFSSKNVLQREQRLTFIDLFYLFLELKLIEWIRPDSFSLTCKDSIDNGECAAGGLFLLLKIINQIELTDEVLEHLNFMLYAPAIIIRERIMVPEKFNRFVNLLKLLEAIQGEFGKEGMQIIKELISNSYDSPILGATILLPRINAVAEAA